MQISLINLYRNFVIFQVILDIFSQEIYSFPIFLTSRSFKVAYHLRRLLFNGLLGRVLIAVPLVVINFVLLQVEMELQQTATTIIKMITCHCWGLEYILPTLARRHTTHHPAVAHRMIFINILIRHVLIIMIYRIFTAQSLRLVYDVFTAYYLIIISLNCMVFAIDSFNFGQNRTAHEVRIAVILRNRTNTRRQLWRCRCRRLVLSKFFFIHNI